MEVDNIKVINPKQSNSKKQESYKRYSYYAGFSFEFSSELIKSLGDNQNKCIIDPWNGSGTTTHSASFLKVNNIGYDLNPVMLIAAKAQNFNQGNTSSIFPLLANILRKSKKLSYSALDEPLELWFNKETSLFLRNIEYQFHKNLVDDKKYSILASDNSKLNSISDIGAFFYVALFNTVRKMLSVFYASNPTWLKKPKDELSKLSYTQEEVITLLRHELTLMVLTINNEHNFSSYSSLQIATSAHLPSQNELADLVLTSPPYCTRIDYAVATMAELAVLGISQNNFNQLRNNLIGGSTIWQETPSPKSEWGETCNSFLSALSDHDSKASKSYYLKNHLQYFDSIHQSASEIERILKPNGLCAIVVQDSYYKEIHNDLPTIFSEIFSNLGLEQITRYDFKSKKSKAVINPMVKKYRINNEATESVIIFKK
jgi:DNA modification methylase